MFALICKNAMAYDFSSSGINYNILSKDDKTIEVVGFSNPNNGISEIDIPNNITLNGVKYYVVAIGKKAFWGCEQLNSIFISYGVSEIGEEAFRGCKGLTSLKLPSSITSIDAFAFADCVGLTTITLESSNIHMEENAFNNCKAVNHLEIPDGSPIDRMKFLESCGSTSGDLTISKFTSFPRPSTINKNTTLGATQDKGMSKQQEKLKIYKGNFKMIGFGYGAYENGVEGVATYHYRDASDGTRIFEEDFSFEGASGYHNSTHYNVSGCFKDNRQVGQWKWRKDTPIDYRTEISESIINFDENSVPIGSFEMWVGYGENQKRSWMSCRFENGKIIYVSYRDRGIITTSGSYNSQGRPTGRWLLTGNSVNNRNCIFVYDANGDCKESYYIDETTGDKVRVYSKYPYEIYTMVLESIRRLCFRSTPKPQF